MTAPDDGLDAWLAGLAGRPGAAPAAARQPEQAEAALLRRLVTVQRAQRERAVLAPSAASEAAHWQRVRLRLAAPMRDEAPPVAAARSGRWAANQPLWAWAAGLAAVAVLLPWAFQLTSDAGSAGTSDGTAGVVMRGGAAPQVLQASTREGALALADQLEEVLRTNEAPYRRVRLGDVGWQIQAKLVPGSEAATALSRLGVQIPSDGLLLLHVHSGIGGDSKPHSGAVSGLHKESQ